MVLLERISALTGEGKATLASQLVQAALPAMAAAADALQYVKDSPREAQRMIARYSTEAVQQLSQAQLELDDLISQTPRTKRQKRRRPEGSNGTT
jgi:ABC-type nitrate/sulfonate/bicarbonate transport system substrate-binding protein